MVRPPVYRVPCRNPHSSPPSILIHWLRRITRAARRRQETQMGGNTMKYRLSFRTMSSLALSASLAGFAIAQSVQRAHVVTTPEGTYRVSEAKPGDGSSGAPRTPPEIRWQYDTGFSIPQTVALSPIADSAWVGE